MSFADMRLNLIGVLCGCAAALSLLPSPACAKSPPRNLQGRALTLVVSSAPGGGYDTLGRLVARYLPAHLPMTSTVVVQNLPGAGGIVAANYLYNTAPNDGTTIGLVQNNTPFEPLMGTNEAQYNAAKFNWLGSPSTETALLVVWHGVPVNSIADIRKRPITVASEGVASMQSFYARLLNATLGTKLQIIVGYRGQADAFLAMERGEVDGFPSTFYSSLMAAFPTWVRDGRLKMLVQYGPRKEPALGHVPFAPDLVSNEDNKLLLQAGSAEIAVGRPFVAPPGVPADRVSALRTALAETFSDPKLLTEAGKMHIGFSEPRSAVDLEQLITSTYKMPLAIVNKLERLSAE
jgi:tripartite-type tricarboxylate transporter receptor subunit TctC